MYERRLSERLVEALADTPVVFLQGARQVGKSTLAKAIAAGEHPAAYLTMDNPAVLAAATADPAGFVAGLDGPVVLDEVQRAPGLALAIKAAVDARRQPGRFLLTGSANVMVLPRLSESLAGRIEVHTLWPLGQCEIGGNRGPSFVDRLFEPGKKIGQVKPIRWDALVQRLLRGGYPEVLGRPREDRRAAWFDAYLTTILQRDVREISNIEHLSEMPRLLALLAARAASLLNYADLARGLALPQSTLKRYMTLLEATFLVRLLPAWSTNLAKRLVKSPKVALADTGLLCHLLGLGARGLGADRTLAGHVLENFVMMELTRQLGWSATRCQMFHFRTESGQEVDCVLQDRRGRVAAVEVKATTGVTPRDMAGLRALAELAGDRFVGGALLYGGADVVPLGPRLHAMPVSALWE